MSTFSCPVVRVAAVENHSGADRLSIVRLDGLGYTCISAKLEDGSHRYAVGDWVVYIPSSSVLPEWLLREMDFWDAEKNKGTLAGSNGDRVKPAKLRGIFSDGLLYPVRNRNGSLYLTDGDGESVKVFAAEDTSNILGITKYEPPIPVSMQGQVANMTGHTVHYDFQRWESVPDIFGTDELVVATEKLHGTFMSIVYVPGLNHPEMFGKNGDIIVHSKGLGAQGLAFKNVPENDGNLYVRTLKHLLETTDLETILERMSGVEGCNHTVAILGECYGKGVQDLDYGTSKPEFRVFDARIGDHWLDEGALNHYVSLPKVPVLYRGPFDAVALEEHRDGVTTVGGTNVREGIVVRAMFGDTHPMHGRKICKFISPAYLLRKVKNGEATEYN